MYHAVSATAQALKGSIQYGTIARYHWLRIASAQRSHYLARPLSTAAHAPPQRQAKVIQQQVRAAGVQYSVPPVAAGCPGLPALPVAAEALAACVRWVSTNPRDPVTGALLIEAWAQACAGDAALLRAGAEQVSMWRALQHAVGGLRPREAVRIAAAAGACCSAVGWYGTARLTMDKAVSRAVQYAPRLSARSQVQLLALCAPLLGSSSLYTNCVRRIASAVSSMTPDRLVRHDNAGLLLPLALSGAAACAGSLPGETLQGIARLAEASFPAVTLTDRLDAQAGLWTWLQQAAQCAGALPVAELEAAWSATQQLAASRHQAAAHMQNSLRHAVQQSGIPPALSGVAPEHPFVLAPAGAWGNLALPDARVLIQCVHWSDIVAHSDAAAQAVQLAADGCQLTAPQCTALAAEASLASGAQLQASLAKAAGWYMLQVPLHVWLAEPAPAGSAVPPLQAWMRARIRASPLIHSMHT